MSEKYRTTRRTYLKGATVTGVAGLVGLSSSAAARQGGPIPMGSILPITGNLSDYGEGMQEAVNIAVRDVNDAGGVLDRQIEMTNTDSQTQPSQAIQQYNSLVNEQDIVGFVGAASSGVSVPLAQNVAADQVMQVSNASTTPALAEIGYEGDTKYFGRTSPNDRSCTWPIPTGRGWPRPPAMPSRAKLSAWSVTISRPATSPRRWIRCSRTTRTRSGSSAIPVTVAPSSSSGPTAATAASGCSARDSTPRSS
ncbi:hypothetical protein BRC82_09615 [Halobacteriales archaeon QS_1_67_19]|nr:MAG: hypothetical protein BRC82_09615 [Halobacteriales archaeon QS_1_67_19]